MPVIAAAKKGFAKVFGSRNERLIKAYRKRVERITQLEPEIRKLTDPQMRQRVDELRRRIADEGTAPEVLYESFALMRESLDRHVGIRNIFNPNFSDQFDVSQLDAQARGLYEKVQAEIETRQPIPEIGQEEMVPPWLQVDIPPALYEAVRAIYPKSRPPFRTRPFDVQLIGGMVLYEGKIAEMKTGEGKTIVAPLACAMAAIEGLRSHVVTVNDYLVQRDRDWVFPALYRLGITVGAIHPQHMQDEHKKQEAYQCDIVYGTNSEFGFDYLRDNMKLSVEDQVQTRRDFCVIDEVDSILIDEARTPLIISGPAHDDAPQYIKANQVAEQLAALQKQANADTAIRLRQAGFVEDAARLHRVPAAQIEKVIAKFCDLGPDYLDEKEAGYVGHTQYYVMKLEQKQSAMTHLGVEQAQKIVGTRFYVVGNDMAWDHLINNALRAQAVYRKDKDYVVQNGEVIIVDENTGRLMIGRQWSDGLHQAVEAKESRHGVKIKQETQTLATVTIQNFFKLYGRLAGMTGTAITEATEFYDIYRLDVVCIPTNVPVIRGDHDDLIFLTEEAKWGAIIGDIKEHAEAGQPVLVGTTSVEKSELVSQMLTKRHGLEHEVLNAKQHEREAHIVVKAGQQHEDTRGRTVGNITIATNMAGRGTDIKLTPEVREAGGLYIVGTERHEARRIDNQLRGRSGRQGDPGASRFFISMEDDLMKLFAGKTTMKALSVLGMKEDDAIEHRWITKSVSRAQSKVEERNYQIRKNLLEYDEVMEYQRSSFYGTRQAVLEGRGIKPLIFDYLAESVEDAAQKYISDDFVSAQVAEAVRNVVGVSIDPTRIRGDSLAEVEPMIRSDAKADVRQEIEINVGEYMSDDMEESEWDLKGLSQWAMSRFSVDLKQSRLRQMTPLEVIDHLTEVAHDLVDRRPLEGLSRFFEPGYAASELADWAKAKFGLELDPADLQPASGDRTADVQQRIAEHVYARAEQAYRRREVEYPVDFELEMVFGAAQQGVEGTAWAADQLVHWAKHRFDLDWSADRITQKSGEEIRNELIEAATEWNGPKLDDWIDKTVAQNDDEGVRQKFADRFAVELAPEFLAAYRGDEEELKPALKEQALGVLRNELTQLEQFVLLQILDQTWKDHLYAMDQLKDSIGLRGFAEKDPKIEYKAEGSRMFQSMLCGVRDKVTDMIFKARLTADVQMQNLYHDLQASHEVIEDTGVTAAAGMGTAEQNADLAAAAQAGSEPQVVQTIVSKGPKVGRNDPCPCGSGKKHKKCCGAGG